MKLSLFLLSFLPFVAAQGNVDYGEKYNIYRSTEGRGDNAALDPVRAHHQRRMEKLEEMIQQRRQLVEDHESGHRKLSDEEFDKASRQFRNFQRKLEQMKNQNTDEHHMERLEEIRSLRLQEIELPDMREIIENARNL